MEMFDNVTLEFTQTHVVLRRPDGTIRKAWHADRVREITQEAEAGRVRAR